MVRSTGSWITVAQEDTTKLECRLKGVFRIHGIKATNPVAVGDRVAYELLTEKGTGIITGILERDNYIVRRSTKLSKTTHILAANIDQVILIVTLAYPRTSTGFIDRFLVTSEAYHIPAVIVFNKIDLHDKEADIFLKKLKKIYRHAEYQCLEVSAVTGEGIESLISVMKDKVSLLAGHSGVGKTTLINRIQPGLNLYVKEISSYHEKGRHATTFAEMHTLSFGGHIIDTPGIKEFGLIDFEKTEVAERFPEMRRLMHQCKYHNCSHTHEPGCAVKKALEEGLVSTSRYENYLKIFHHEDWDEETRDYRNT